MHDPKAIRCIPIVTCSMCPYRKRNYGQWECSKFNFLQLPPQEAANGIEPSVPTWCPLPPHPSFWLDAAKETPQ